MTCCCLDDRERKLFIGDSDGRIVAINVKKGQPLRKFEKHENKDIITDLVYFAQETSNKAKGQEKLNDTSKILVSASRTNSIKIHDDSFTNFNLSRNYEMKQHRSSVNGLSIKYEGSVVGGGIDGVVASCSDDSTIIITNLSSFRFEAQLKPAEGLYFKKVLFLNPYDALVSADGDGQLFFFAYSPEKKFKHVFTKQYMAASQTNAEVVEMSPVTAMNFDPKNLCLLLGDEFGNIELWDCSKFIERIQTNTSYFEQKFDKRKTIKQNGKANANVTSLNKPTVRIFILKKR